MCSHEWYSTVKPLAIIQGQLRKLCQITSEDVIFSATLKRSLILLHKQCQIIEAYYNYVTGFWKTSTYILGTYKSCELKFSAVFFF